MAITQNNITFNDLSRIGKGSRFANVINPDIQSESDLQDYMGAGEEYRNIQSVLIDWNGAQLKNGSTVKATLNTTGEMLSILQTA